MMKDERKKNFCLVPIRRLKVGVCNLSYNFAEMVTFTDIFSFIGECNCFTALKGAINCKESGSSVSCFYSIA